MKHPAIDIEYSDLIAGLDVRVAQGYIKRVVGEDGLVLYNYTNSCMFDGAWDDYTTIARGLIIDTVEHKIVALPFPKFFNFGERNNVFKDLSFTVYEKLDGSMITLFFHKGKWRTATRGSFDSDQAKWAATQIDKLKTSYLEEGTTYLFEAIYTSNRIVVRYDYESLVLLGAFDQFGQDASPNILETLAIVLNCKVAKVYNFKSFQELMKNTSSLTRNEEGFVVRFEDGTRLKFKGDEYKRVHALISNLTPLSIWNSLVAEDDLVAIKRDLPEEFWTDFDSIYNILTSSLNEELISIAALCQIYGHLSAKEIGLSTEIHKEYKLFLFNYLKSGDPLLNKGRDTLYKFIRPNGNILPGYSASKTLTEAQIVEG